MGKRMRKGSKYHSRKIERNGMVFDSQKEYKRFCELSLLERAGTITDLQFQVPFELIPAQYEEIPTGEFYKRGERKGQEKIKRICVEKSIKYIADFVYQQDGQMVVEDVKGYRDPQGAAYAKFTIKRKMMLYFHGIKIKEV